MTTVGDILDYQRQVGTWVDWERTVDGVIVGSADAEVRDAAVGWIPSYEALRKAVELGCQLFVTHEPTFYSHRNELEHLGAWPGAEEKNRFIEEGGLTILRNHDTWDFMPEVGIPWAWAAFLEMDGEPLETGYGLHVYAVEEMTLDALARRVARRTAAIGEPAVQMAGEPGLRVRKVGIGTGCGCDPVRYRRMGADAGIVCDDGTSYWSNIQWAVDNSFGIVRVNHGTSEEPGVAAMARHLAERFPEVNFHHIPQGCRFSLVSSAG